MNTPNFPRLIILLAAWLLALPAFTQDLGSLISQAYTFDGRFPRETVYLHTDNASYIQGDTLWYKAFVVRASTLRPDSTLSRTLYVELLNDAGTLLQRSTLRLDSLGQGHGNFALTPPLQNGFYEIRAYTRAMTNWFGMQDAGEAGYFSRVFPLFEIPRKALPGDFTNLEIHRPESEQDFKLPHERPYSFGSKKERHVELFPEGGRLAAGTLAHVAYRLTDGTGMPQDDSIAVYAANGELLATSAPAHEGMGAFAVQLPADAASDAKGPYVQVAGHSKHFALPPVAETAVALHAYEGTDEESGAPVMNFDLQPAAALAVPDEGGGEAPLHVAVIAFSREVPYKVFPLELFEGMNTLVVDMDNFKAGVNRIEVVDAEGTPLASRMLFVREDAASRNRMPQLTVRQNAESYDAFDPIVLSLELKDEDGRPLPFTTLSVSVRDEQGELIVDEQPSLSTQLNVCSELQGYVHQPEAYFMHDDPAHRRTLDLMMQIQGWLPETWAQLCKADIFAVQQPMEDFPIVRGRVIKDKDRTQPLANVQLGMTMYNDQWHVLKAHTQTDSEGVFAFESHDDFVGDFTTQFSVKNAKGHNLWHRVMLDQWFGPHAKKYSTYEMQALRQPNRAHQTAAKEASTEAPADRTTLPDTVTQSGRDADVPLFEWTDTIPRALRTNLGEAMVKHKKSFVFELTGQEFDRYSYGGGEAHSIRHSDTYFNVEHEIQRIRDTGIDVFTITDFLCYLIGDESRSLNPDPMIHADLPDGLVTRAQTIETFENAKESVADKQSPSSNTAEKSQELENLEAEIKKQEEEVSIPEILTTRGRKFYVIVNNAADLPLNQKNMQMPEQLKSVIVSYNAAWATSLWAKYHPGSDEHFDGIIYVHSRPDWHNYRNVRGTTKRTLHGITRADEFKGPDYRRTHAEDESDFRRTLYWNPCLTTDADGCASIILFANARWRQYLRISVRGITADGRVIEYDR